MQTPEEAAAASARPASVGTPILVVGPDPAATAAVSTAILSAPGAVDASVLLGESAGDTTPGPAAALVEFIAATDRASWAPGVVARPVLVLPPEGSLTVVLEELPSTRVVHVHQDPASCRTADEVTGWVHRSNGLVEAFTGVDPATRVATSVAGLRRESQSELQRVLAALGLGWHPSASTVLVRALEGLSGGETDEAVIRAVESVADRVARSAALAPEVEPSLLPTSAPGSLSARDHKLAELLRRLGGSLLVSTYQSNRVLSLRPEEGRLGVHLRAFDRPMGIAVTSDGLALGTRSEIIDFRDLPPAAAQIEPAGTWDACYLPRNTHITGDIAVHDLGVGRGGLWLVATNFNCLATLDQQHSFVPQWRPPFITELVNEDRCHLNGMALVDGLPRYVTALGTSNENGGWRPRKATGGVLMEVPSGRVLVSGLSMPHSPRWHEGALYVLESGQGRLLRCDPETGASHVVAQLPGFTRGLTFCGRIAFVATSQVRETATFGGLPIASAGPLTCGVWAVDLRTGAVMASVKFEDRIQELFDVAFLPGVRKPEIAEPGSSLVQTAWVLPRPG